jgi:hypothetical protein
MPTRPPSFLGSERSDALPVKYLFDSIYSSIKLQPKTMDKDGNLKKTHKATSGTPQAGGGQHIRPLVPPVLSPKIRRIWCKIV